MDNNLVSVVKGNDFILDLYVSKYDKDQGKQVPYDVSEATDVVLRLIGNNGFIKVIRDAQPNEFKITANVDGHLRDGKYGVELLFKINNMDKRIYQANKIEILNCNCCVDAGAQTTHVIPTYDLSMYMGVDVEKINFGAVTYGNIDSVLSETSTNPVMNKTVTAALKEADKIGDILVNGESVIKDKVAEIIMPTKVSELDNDAGYLTEHQSLTDYAKISDVDASLNLKADKTSIPTVPSFKTINGEEITGTGNIEIKSGSDPVDLSDYAKISDVDASLDLKADKTSIPTVPTKVSEFTNDAGYLTEHQSLTDYAKKTDIPVIPTKLSAFNNDEGFIKNTVTDLVNYYKKSETYTQAEVNELISKIPKFAIDVVDELPTSEISLTTVYLVKTSETTDNMYTEYIYVNNVWEKLGEQKVNLTDYYTKNQIDNFLNEKADKTEIPDMKPYAKISDVDASLAKYTSTDSFNALNTEVLKKANKSYVDETFQVKGNYITEIPAEYVTETELEGKGYLTEHQSLTDYAKKTDIVTYKSGNGITIGTDNTINALIGKGKGVGSLLGPNATSSTGQYAVSLGSGTTASGNSSHAEGNWTTASGGDSHAEGNGTTASNWYSHAEGNGTTASGGSSHAEGNFTIASNESEHASGQYNISNKASDNFGDVGNTLFSVGNGTGFTAKHNAFEIRQNGDIYITDSSMGAPYKLQDKLNNCATKSEISTVSSFKTINGEEITGTGNININIDTTIDQFFNPNGSNPISGKGVGDILFKEYPASGAENLNPKYIKVSYTIDNTMQPSPYLDGLTVNIYTPSGSSINKKATGKVEVTHNGSEWHVTGLSVTGTGLTGIYYSDSYAIFKVEGYATAIIDNYGGWGPLSTSVVTTYYTDIYDNPTLNNPTINGTIKTNINDIPDTSVDISYLFVYNMSNNNDSIIKKIRIDKAIAQAVPELVRGNVGGIKIWTGTQAEYDAITTKDDNTVYFVK